MTTPSTDYQQRAGQIVEIVNAARRDPSQAQEALEQIAAVLGLARYIAPDTRAEQVMKEATE